MSHSNEYILVLEKNEDYRDKIKEKAETICPQYKLEFVEKIEDAYWIYLENSELCKLVLLDLDLEEHRPGKHFDGIDLALAIDILAGRKEIEPPWIVALTGANDDILECFFNFSTAAPLKEVIRKTIVEIEERIPILFSALSANDPKKYIFPRQSNLHSFKPKIEELDDETLNQLILMDKNISKSGCEKLINEISKKSLNSYRLIKFTALAPGYSGSGVLSATVHRSGDSADTRTFVIKICKDNKDNVEAIKKLDNEVENYFKHVKLIRNYVPLLIGPFCIKGWKFIAYEFISYMGIGVRTFADHLKSALQDKITLNAFELGHYGTSSVDIFEKILKGWHEFRNKDVKMPSDTHTFYENWFKQFLAQIEQKITQFYPEIAPCLYANKPFLNLDLGLGENLIKLANPVNVVKDLLRRNGDSYYEHYLQNGIVHGDLHSGNILRSVSVAGDFGEWKLIDFANIYESAHLAQDGARLECDIKFQKILPVNLEHRFVLEVQLARQLDEVLSAKLNSILTLEEWSGKWKEMSNDYKLVESQIVGIRQMAIRRLYHSNFDDSYSRFLDYTIALLMQSLMFVRYLGNPIRILHAWLAACLAATLVHQYSSYKREEKTKVGLSSRSVNRIL
jgi:DNA-dependent RNA polymerase auxiliary subunit epsilon